ncbi:MAG: hypothetical protein ACYC5K_10600 [Saccharofermentanales bacterium]
MKRTVGIILSLILMIGLLGSMTSAEDMVYSSGFQGMCKQGISNGFYYMYRDVADGGKVQEFPKFNIKSTTDDLSVNMAWTLSTTQAFPFMTNYSTHPEVGLNPILQWRATAKGTVIYRVVEMGATFYAEDGEVRKTAIFMNDKGENADGVTVTLYKNTDKANPIKAGLVSSTSDFTFNETISVNAGDTINLEYDSNTSKSGDATYGLFELTFIEAAAPTATKAPTSAAVSQPASTASSEAASTDESAAASTDESTEDSTTASETGSQAESTEESTVSQSDESSASSAAEPSDDAKFPTWAIILIAVVVVAGAGAVAYVIIKGKK